LVIQLNSRTPANIRTMIRNGIVKACPTLSDRVLVLDDVASLSVVKIEGGG
jgi:hypothetical protein